MKKQKVKTTVKLLIILAEVCFLFPFVMVSCSGSSVELSGAELMTKVSLHEELQFDEDDSPNYYLLGAFALGAIGLGVIWKSKEEKKGLQYAGYLTVGSALFLLLFRSTFISFYDLKGYEGRIDIEFRWGWWLSLLSYVIAAACSFIGIQQSEQPSAAVPNDKDISIFPPATDGSHFEVAPIEETSSSEGLYEEQSQQPTEELEDKPSTPATLSVKLHIQYDGKKVDYLIEEFPCLIGRDSASCPVKIEDSKVSRVHAQLIAKNNAVFIEDLGSSNGTEVNGQHLSGITELLSGDEVIVGSTKIYFEIGAE